MFYTKKTKQEIYTAIDIAIDIAINNALQEVDVKQVSLESMLNARIAEACEAMRVKIEANVQKSFQDALEADRQKRYESKEPFVEIVSQTFSEEGGVQLKLDWNSAFVKYLKENGFTGVTDETIVDNWLVSLSNQRLAEGGSEYK
jgi:hypothetical protein